MYNLKKHDLILFNPDRSPFGCKELCLGFVVTDPDFNDLNGNHGASFQFVSPGEYFKNNGGINKIHTFISGYSGRTGNVIYNFGKVTEEQFLSITHKTTFSFL